MTLATPERSGRGMVSIFSSDLDGFYPARREGFAFSLIGQLVLLAILVLLTSLAVRYPPVPVAQLSEASKNLMPVIFTGPSGGGGGGLDPVPASHSDLPKASLRDQLTPPTVIVPKEMPKLAVEPTVMIAPQINLAESKEYGDPLAKLSGLLSNGPGGPGGIYVAGVKGVTAPRVIYNPEPGFSDEARKAKAQGRVVLLVVVGPDGHTHDLRVQSSLEMGLVRKL